MVVDYVELVMCLVFLCALSVGVTAYNFGTLHTTCVEIFKENLESVVSGELLAENLTARRKGNTQRLGISGKTQAVFNIFPFLSVCAI